MKENKLRNKLILAAALTGLVAGSTVVSSQAFAGDGAKAKTEKGHNAKCADGSCGDKAGKKKKKKGHDAKCADGSCGDKAGKMKKKKKGHDAKCADGSCGDKAGKKK